MNIRHIDLCQGTACTRSRARLIRDLMLTAGAAIGFSGGFSGIAQAQTAPVTPDAAAQPTDPQEGQSGGEIVVTGYRQSIEASLSTFSAHIQNIASMDRSLQSPALVLLDEVGSGLTREEKEHLARFILRLQAQGSRAILWVEHDVGMIRDLSDSVVVLNYGRKLAEGRAEDIFSRSEVREAFIGLHAETT